MEVAFEYSVSDYVCNLRITVSRHCYYHKPFVLIILQIANDSTLVIVVSVSVLPLLNTCYYHPLSPSTSSHQTHVTTLYIDNLRD